MSAKPIIPRTRAEQDIDEAITHYLDEQAPRAASGFVDALEAAYRHVARHPASGSSRYAHELDLPDLRSWPLSRYPFLVFYVERPQHIDVWRVLHTRRNLPVWLQEPG
ncbi:type II toxin-antitoxin system RelE/ParE family toxin [Achromobacter sp. Marseille-Q0513]|uniref:type II toxin-antitoxin system RelE/ParE family toxin n=1 Tax=Achromobacter sp. Marseille-Q0513 TaxID=2829161 RepID=UPI001B908C24|nr:type II toxin-antitoxin system RelE/ParE family toxin [Achromobacter sp. Marseille-Q0513]MBR8656964.1 type II toxin-antitoxin system RelE/ParE family toxin [Achromobacter sp. Marseille-Q0513]